MYDVQVYKNGERITGVYLAVVNGDDTGQMLTQWSDGTLTVEDATSYDPVAVMRNEAMLKAAPLLYEALVKELEFLKAGSIPDWGRIDMIEAAIAAARGTDDN